jgi:uncharacterized membrane protein
MAFLILNLQLKQLKAKFMQSNILLMLRPSHHLNLSKSQTQKIKNLNPIYYNKDEDIILREHEKRKIIDTLKKYRNFKSYSSHNLYTAKGGVGEGGLLDKFYEVKQ